MLDLNEKISRFAIEGEVKEIRPLGNGLINETFLIKTGEGTPDYVMQRINHNVFNDVETLQTNVEAVTRHIRKKLSEKGESDIDRKVLTLVPVKGSDKTFIFDGEGYWRITIFIPDSVTVDAVTPESSRDAGRAFGNFQAMLVDIDADLKESIPDFHNMEFRLRQLREAVAADPKGRVAEVKDILDIIENDADEMCRAEQLHREGKLPKRICHCDTKVNNVLFDQEGKVLCVIDLDTVMPSFIFSDYGDFLRTGACTSPEDEPDLSKVDFNMDIFKAFTEGYLSSASSFITPLEKEMLPTAVAMFPFMQAVRFLADYINGDTYYRIAYPEHNLVRTRAQIKLYQRVKEVTPELKSFIDKQ